MGKKSVGNVSHYFGKISVVIIDLTAPLKVGDKISIEKGTRTLEQTVESIQIEHKSVQEAKKGDSVGLRVSEKVAKDSKVFVIT